MPVRNPIRTLRVTNSPEKAPVLRMNDVTANRITDAERDDGTVRRTHPAAPEIVTGHPVAIR